MRGTWMLLAAACFVGFVGLAGESEAGWWWPGHHRRAPAPQAPLMPIPPAAVASPSVEPPPATTTPETMPPLVVPTPQAAPPAGEVAAADPGFSPLVSAALGDSSFAVSAPGYLDSAKPQTQIRFRFDAAYDFNRPDRAEFFYPKCGCFGMGAPGPPLPETNINSTQEPDLYVEYAATERFSVFIDTPYRFINPEVNRNANGFGDLRYGFKYAFLYTDSHIVTLQVRGFAPTGDAYRGLGTRHSTIEPSILYMGRWSDKVTVFGQIGEWVPIDGTDFAGNILQYGVGVGYTFFERDDFKVTPLVEMLGWTVQSGQELDPVSGTAVSAVNDTIVNAKFGVRFGTSRHDAYIGYGRALTGERWYQDIFRVEYRWKF